MFMFFSVFLVGMGVYLGKKDEFRFFGLFNNLDRIEISDTTTKRIVKYNLNSCN